MSDESKPIPMGRPPIEYKPEYPEMLIKHMSEGRSFETFAAIIGTCRAVIYTWVDKYPEFADAKKTGNDASYMFWESKLLNHVVNVSQSSEDENGRKQSKSEAMNAACFIFAMKNRFGWRDKQEIEHTGDDQKPVNMNIFNLKYARKPKPDENK